MSRLSCGLVMYRRRAGGLEVLLVHPGGPCFAKKDDGHWSIPKGEPDGAEDPLAVAIREFAEETGFTAAGPFLELGTIQQKGGKTVHAWAFEGDCDPSKLRSNRIRIEWPPRSGRCIEIPEVDRGAFFDLEQAKRKIKPAQIPLLERLAAKLA